jgi:hypothetical protein
VTFAVWKKTGVIIKCLSFITQTQHFVTHVFCCGVCGYARSCGGAGPHPSSRRLPQRQQMSMVLFCHLQNNLRYTELCTNLSKEKLTASYSCSVASLLVLAAPVPVMSLAAVMALAVVVMLVLLLLLFVLVGTISFCCKKLELQIVLDNIVI